MATDTLAEPPTPPPHPPRSDDGSARSPESSAKATCHLCGYALDGLPSSICPECGQSTLPAPGPSLTERAATGFFFMAMQTVATRAIGVLGNLMLAWLLLPEHFGLVAIANGVVAFVQVIQTIGIREVLVRKQSSYKHLANAGFWISLTVGMIGMLAVAAVAPLAAWFYDQPALLGLLLVLSLALPTSSMSLVPEARLQIDLRFRLLAQLNMITSAGATVLTVACAFLGMGAYSFIVPRVVAWTLRMTVAWNAAGFRPRFRLQFDRWRFIIGDSIWVLLSNLCIIVTTNADVLLLGRALGKTGNGGAALGLYTFAVGLSLQFIVLLAFSLGQVMMPTLSKLAHDPARQGDAMVRAMRVLGMLIIPTCVLQAAVAEPVVQLIFPAKWAGSIAVLQALSLSMSLRFYGVAVAAMFHAQGRFRGYFRWTFVMAALFIVAVAPVVFLTRDIVYTAIAVAVWGAVVEPWGLYFALRRSGLGWSAVFSTFVYPLLLSIGGCGLGMLVARHAPLPAGAAGLVVQIVIVSAIAGLVYAIGARMLMRPTWNEAADRIGPLLNKIKSRVRPSAA